MPHLAADVAAQVRIFWFHRSFSVSGPRSGQVIARSGGYSDLHGDDYRRRLDLSKVSNLQPVWPRLRGRFLVSSESRNPVALFLCH